MDIKRNGTSPSVKGPTDYFTGAVRIDTPFKAAEPARTGGAIVTFEPGARTAWHTHPLGQLLVVTSGLGWSSAAAALPAPSSVASAKRRRCSISAGA